jgi:hypothetical protein
MAGRTFGWRFSVVWLVLVALSAAWTVTTAAYSWIVSHAPLAGGLLAGGAFLVLYTVLAIVPALLVAGLWQAVVTVFGR